MSMTVYVPVDTKTPGVITKVEQQIDLKSLPSDQFTRVLNAAKAGVTNGDGYIAELLRRIASVHKIMPPVVISKSDWQGLRVTHPLLSHSEFAPHIEELKSLSDVRHQMHLASTGKKDAWEMNRKSVFSDKGKMPVLQLVGWDKSTAPLKKEIQKRLCSLPAFKADQEKLIAAIMAKPSMTITRTVKD